MRNAARIDVYSPEEVWSLVRAAACEEDAAAYLIAAFAGLRMGELLAVRWREVDFERRVLRVTANYTHWREGTPKSDRMRAVPVADSIAQALARLSLRERYAAAQKAAGLRPLRFHDLRHSFGTLAINRASPLQVKAWMGHASLKTTERYLHYREQGDEADLLSGVFEERVPNVAPNRPIPSASSATERT